MMTTLFYGRRLDEWLADRTAEAIRDVNREAERQVRDSALAVAERVIEEYDVARLTLHSDQPKVSTFETTIDGVDGFSGDRFSTPAVGVRAVASFEGDSMLFHLRPSSFSSGGPPQGDLSGRTITIEIVQSDPDPAKVKAAIRAQFGMVRQYVEWVNGDIDRWRPQMADAVRTAVSARSARLRSADQLLANLSFDDE